MKWRRVLLFHYCFFGAVDVYNQAIVEYILQLVERNAIPVVTSVTKIWFIIPAFILDESYYQVISWYHHEHFLIEQLISRQINRRVCASANIEGKIVSKEFYLKFEYYFVSSIPNLSVLSNLERSRHDITLGNYILFPYSLATYPFL